MRGRVKNFRRTVGQQTTAISLKPRCVNVNAEAEEGHLGLSHLYSLMHMRLPFLPLSTAEETVCWAEPLIEADWNYKAFLRMNSNLSTSGMVWIPSVQSHMPNFFQWVRLPDLATERKFRHIFGISINVSVAFVSKHKWLWMKRRWIIINVHVNRSQMLWSVASEIRWALRQRVH